MSTLLHTGWQRRRFPRPSPWLVVAAVAGLVLAAASFVLGGAVMRPAPPAAVTAPVRVVPLPQGASRLEAGVPVGYEQTESGAVDAATNYLVALNGPLVLHPDQFRAAEGVIAAPAYRTQMLAEGDASLRALNSSFGFASNGSMGIPIALRLAPIAYHLDSYDGEHAAVSVWAVWVFAEGGILAPQQHWFTATYLLEWTGGDWRVSGASARPGPIPAPPQQTVADPSSPLPDALTNYREYQHVSA